MLNSVFIGETMSRSKFTQRFNDWREEKAKDEKENSRLETAILMADYVKKSNLTEIKSDLVDTKSEKYKEFDKYDDRFLSTFVFSQFVLADYRDSLPEVASKEKELLSSLIQTLRTLYENPPNKVGETIKSLIGGFKRWTEEYANSNPDKAKVQDVFKSLYVIMRKMHIYLAGLNYLTANAAKLMGLNVEELKGTVAQMLDAIDQKHQEIVKLQDVANVGDGQVAAPKSLVEHLNDLDLKLLTDPNLPILDKVKALEQRIKETPGDLLTLIESRDYKVELEAKKAKVETLLKALKDNNTSVTGRQYFLDFIDKNRDSFNAFMEVAPDGELKAGLLATIKELEEPSLYRKTASAVQYTASLVTAIPTSVFRYIAPQFVQNTATNTFDTIDSAAKRDLQRLIEEHLTKISNQLKTAEERVEKASEKIANGDQQVKKSILTCKVSELLEAATTLQKTNKEQSEVLGQYSDLYQEAMSSNKTLHQLAGLDKEVDKFIDKHDNFLVTLSNFFAELFKIFKSEKAELVDQAVEIRDAISELKDTHNKGIEADIKKIQDNPHISDSIKASLIQQLTSPQQNIGETLPELHEDESVVKQTPKEHIAAIQSGFFSASAKPQQAPQSNPGPEEQQEQTKEEGQGQVIVGA